MMYFKGVKLKKVGYCKCSSISSVTSEIEEWGYWNVCCRCGKHLKMDSIIIIIMMEKITMI